VLPDGHLSPSSSNAALPLMSAGDHLQSILIDDPPDVSEISWPSSPSNSSFVTADEFSDESEMGESSEEDSDEELGSLARRSHGPEIICTGH
jgi:hypothetical protein